MSGQAGEFARFRQLQDAVFEESGVRAASRFVEIAAPPLRVHVLEAGAGDPVLLVHGGNSVAASWAPMLAPLAGDFRLLMPDRPGCGLTTAFDYRGVDLRIHGAGFLSGVLDALGHQRAAVVGNSMGGFFAMALALAHPGRVSRLVLLGEPANAAGAPKRFHRLVGTRGVNTVLYKTALRPPADAGGARAGLARGRLVADPGRPSETLLECLAAAARLPGAARSWTTMVEQVFVPPGRGLFARDTLATHALVPELGRLTAPTLFLWGDKDPLGTPDVGRMLVDKMPDARLQVVDDAGHLPWLDHPKVCADAVAAFLAA